MKCCRIRKALSLSVLWSLAGCVLLAQTAPPEQAGQTATQVLRLRGDLVVLDVVATDKDDHVVADLKKEDFQVYENGVLQTIRTLDAPGAHTVMSAAPAIDHNGHPTWGEAPITVVVLDQLNTPVEEIAYSRDQLFKYLQGQPALLPEPTALIVLNDRGIQSATPPTRDRDALLKIARHQDVSLPFKLKRADSDELLSESFALLRQIALSTRGDAGRKNVIWVGRGFPGLDPMALTGRDREAFLNAVRNTVDMLLDARVALYKIDPRTNLVSSLDSGLDDTGLTSPAIADDPFATDFNFNAFVAQTGGKVFRYRNDLAREIQESVSQGSNFYTLSYKPMDLIQDGKYRKLTVRINRPGVSVRSKEGFYAGAGPGREEPNRKELGFDLRQAAVSGMQYNGVGIHLSSKTWDPNAGKMQVKISVDTASLSFEPAGDGSEQTSFLVTMAALDEKGKILNFETVSPRVSIPAAQADQIPSGHTTVPAALLVPPHAHSVRIIVRDSSGRIGTADMDPAFVASLQWHMPALPANGARWRSR